MASVCVCEFELRRKLLYFFMSPCEKRRNGGKKPVNLLIQTTKITIITIQYLTLQSVSVGNYAFQRINGTDTPLTLCQRFYTHQEKVAGNQSASTRPDVQTECVHVYAMKLFNISDFHLEFKRLLSLDVYMEIKTINVQTVRHDELPDCYHFSVTVVFDNSVSSGQIKVSLRTDVQLNVCADVQLSGSINTGIRLLAEYTALVNSKGGNSLTSADRMEFINGWNITVVISDVLSVTASILKLCILTKHFSNYTVVSVLLGTATVLVWTGILRYLGFFRKYNVLLLTVRAVCPSVLRFSLCALMIYLSYCFCGWIVLGPHHQNFRSFHTAVCCLLSLINGDEVYSSFSKLRVKSTVIWIFSRFYIYSFISIFSYMVLSLFIAIITDTYQLIKQQQQQDNEVFSDLQMFLSEC